MAHFRKINLLGGLFCVLWGVSGCSSTPESKISHYAPLLPGMEEAPAEAPLEVAPERTTHTHSESDAITESSLGSPRGGIPFQFNQKVKQWIHYFSEKNRTRFQRYLDRGQRYRGIIQRILRKEGVPVDLYYLAMIESGFELKARSSMGAVGPWQFIRSTGRAYGLRTSGRVDERKDLRKSTRAAAKFLKTLHGQFGSWYLAMAAYNAGGGRIRQSIRKGRTRDFWELVRKRVLPRETMAYIPKYIAARYIGEHPHYFGFYINEGLAP